MGSLKANGQVVAEDSRSIEWHPYRIPRGDLPPQPTFTTTFKVAPRYNDGMTFFGETDLPPRPGPSRSAVKQRESGDTGKGGRRGARTRKVKTRPSGLATKKRRG